MLIWCFFDSHYGFLGFFITVICNLRMAHIGFPVDFGSLSADWHEHASIVNCEEIYNAWYTMWSGKLWLWDVFILTWDDTKQFPGLTVTIYVTLYKMRKTMHKKVWSHKNALCSVVLHLVSLKWLEYGHLKIMRAINISWRFSHGTSALYEIKSIQLI